MVGPPSERVSATGEAFAGIDTGDGVAAAGAGAEGLLLRQVEHRIGEVGTVDAGTAEAALHQHPVAQDRAAEIAVLEAGGVGNHVLEIGAAKIGSLQVGAIENGAAQIGSTEIEACQRSLEKLRLLQLAPVLIGLQILHRSLSPEFRSGDRHGMARPGEKRGGAHGEAENEAHSDDEHLLQPCDDGLRSPVRQGMGRHGARPTVDRQVMATMAMTLRVVVPPHPLIGHWLSVLRDRDTPAPVYATAMAELGRWLTYEALRQWLPHREVQVHTELATTEGLVVDGSVPLVACVLGTGALGVWDGARPVLPNTRVLHLSAADPRLPADLDQRSGVLVFAPEVADGVELLRLLERLAEQGFGGERIRVITPLVASPGLVLLGERFADLTLHTACIDAELDAAGRIRPGIGSVVDRLFAGQSLESVGSPA
jgi:uracil phosphoribosyltransferase